VIADKKSEAAGNKSEHMVLELPNGVKVVAKQPLKEYSSQILEQILDHSNDRK